jgi:anti-anti-sigma regulatory factor
MGAMLETVRAEDMLWVSGNVVPSEEKGLEEEIQKFLREVKGPQRLLDMSGVRYMSTSAAKSLMEIGNEVLSSGGRLKVRAALPVIQTVNRLGADKCLDIEPCQKPTPRPGAVAEPTPAADLPPVKDAGRAGVDPLYGETRRASVGLNVPGQSLMRPAAPGQASADAAIAEAAARAGTLLIPEDQEVPPHLSPLKRLVVMQTYTFHVTSARNDITGRVVSHLGGPWILVDVHGARKMINLGECGVIDLLA